MTQSICIKRVLDEDLLSMNTNEMPTALRLSVQRYEKKSG